MRHVSGCKGTTDKKWSKLCRVTLKGKEKLLLPRKTKELLNEKLQRDIFSILPGDRKIKKEQQALSYLIQHKDKESIEEFIRRVNEEPTEFIDSINKISSSKAGTIALRTINTWFKTQEASFPYKENANKIKIHLNMKISKNTVDENEKESLSLINEKESLSLITLCRYYSNNKLKRANNIRYQKYIRQL